MPRIISKVRDPSLFILTALSSCLFRSRSGDGERRTRPVQWSRPSALRIRVLSVRREPQLLATSISIIIIETDGSFKCDNVECKCESDALVDVDP